MLFYFLNYPSFFCHIQNTLELLYNLFFMFEKDKRIEELRMKTGRSKRCLDCKKHRCIISSCQCDCHRDFSGVEKPKIFRQNTSKKEY